MANTTNLDLVKPAGTDKALVSVINANSDKIDAFAGSTNQAISTVKTNTVDGNNIGNVASMDALKTALVNLATSAGDSKTITFRFYPNFTDADAGFYSAGYGERMGTMYIRNSTRFTCIITFQDGIVTRMSNNNGTWSIDQLALKSETIVQNTGDAHTWNARAVDTSSPSSNTCRIARFGRLIKVEFQCRIKSDVSADDNAILFLPAKYRRMMLARGFVCEVGKTSANGIVGYCGFDSWTQNGSVVDGVYIGAINQFAGKLVAGFVLYWLQTDPNGNL